MKIAVFGLGYVGMTEAACLARQGHEVIGVDVNDEKIAMVNSGRSPIAEPGLAELIRPPSKSVCSRDQGRRAAHRFLPRGLRLRRHAERAGRLAQYDLCGRGLPPDRGHDRAGPGRAVDGRLPLDDAPRHDGRADPPDLRSGGEGAVRTRLQPGIPARIRRHRGLLRTAEDRHRHHDAGPCEALDLLNADIKAPLFYTHYREAELTKFVDNTFHAVKIAFANEIGRVCGELGISARTVHRIFVSDTKLNISPYYFRPGGPFGGSCLPKDVRALQHIAGDIGAHTHLVDALLRSNEAHKHYLFERCVKDLAPGARILMLGLAFKAGSDDMRESPNIDLARKFLQANFDLSIFDPHIEPAKLIGQNLGYAFSNLPTFRRLLVSKTAAELEQYDLVVDTRGLAKELTLHAGRIIDINTLD